jgi:phosphoenolpyruvate carboxykinase (GTP)
MSSETTAAQAGAVGKLRFDPFAMLPFCGYNMGDYFAHWLEVGAGADAAKLPRLYWVNWFRKGPEGKFLWPGYGENSRVIRWIVERLDGTAPANETPIGNVPTPDSLDTRGLGISPEVLAQLVSVDATAWREELPLYEQHFAFIGERLPAELRDELRDLEKRLTE